MATSAWQLLTVLHPRRLWHIWNNVRLGWRLAWDGRIGWLPRVVLLAAVTYVVLPVDLLPDVFPLAGRVDDLAILLLAWRFFLSLCPAHVVDEHARAIAMEYIRHGRRAVGR